MTDFLAPMNYNRARDVLSGLKDYHLYNHDDAERSIQLLKNSYPMVFSKLQEKHFSNDAILLETQGSGKTSPLVFLCHLDSESFEEGSFSARQPVSLNRAHLIALLEALEALLFDGYIPAGDLLICLSMDTLTGGIGAQDIADYLQIRSVHPCYVLDSGGYVSKNSFSTFLRRTISGALPPLALVGITEKGEMQGKITPRSGAECPTDDLFRVAANFSEHRIKTKLCNASRQMLVTIGRQSKLIQRCFLLYPGLSFPLLRVLWRSRTVFHHFFQQERILYRIDMNGSLIQEPKECTLFFRQTLLPGQKCSEIQKKISSRYSNVDICFTVAMDSSQRAETFGESWDALTTAIQIQFEHAVVVPCLSPFVTDARFFRELSSNVYRFSPFLVNDEEGSAGVCTLTDDRLQTAVQFFRSMLSV